MHTFEITSWELFQRVVNVTNTYWAWPPGFSFRGQADSKWALRPSLLRSLPKGADEAYALKIEKQALQLFQSQAGLFINPNDWEPFNNVIHWWSLMQHHGAPTRLLDWTESAYVAAYFAVVEKPEADGAVWFANVVRVHEEVFQGIELRSVLAQKDEEEFLLQPNAPTDVFFVHRERKTERMVPQQGRFSVCRNILGDHEGLLSALEPQTRGERDEEMIFGKYIIPAELKLEFLKQLRVMNVTGNSLFPGLDGLGRSIAEWVKLSELGWRERDKEETTAPIPLKLN